MQIQQRDPLIVEITFRNYWYEEVPKVEAMRRLRARGHERAKLEEIERSLPEVLVHIISFEGGVFREYAGSSAGLLYPLLTLPLKRREETYRVALPAVISKGADQRKSAQIAGWGVTEFRILENGRLTEDDRPIEQLRNVTGPTPIKVNVSHLDPHARPDGNCCLWCEIAHSILDIHSVDCLCCGGWCDDCFWWL